MPLLLNTIGIAGLAWFFSYTFFIEREYHSKHNWDRGALAYISLIPAVFAALASL